MSVSGGPTFRLHAPPPAPPPPALDPAQAAVVRAVTLPGHGPLLVLAGPGTGKTTTVIEAVAARVAAGTPPDEVLTLTFSRKAAVELRSRLTERLGQAVAQPLAWTFHAFGYRLLTEAWARADLAVAPPDAGGQSPGSAGATNPRLLSGPEQDVVVRELLAGSTTPWPAALAPALPTRGFTDELRALLARARAVGLDPDDLAELGGHRADWVAAASFGREYLEVMALSGSLDYTELVAQAARFAESDEGQQTIRQRWSLVVVDEYQDTDPEQERLVQALAGGGRDLVVVGDPDQSIYAFRGAQVRNILQFARRFPRTDGTDARVLTLRTSRRCPPAILEASRRVARRLPLTGLPAGLADTHRRLQARASGDRGQVEVIVHPTLAAEREHVADVLRSEHLRNGTPWSQMAVLVRSSVGTLPGLRRALIAAGVPVDIAADEVPLSGEPAVAPLLLALRAVAVPEDVTPELSRSLLLSPLGGVDPAQLRQLGRLLRKRAREELVAAGRAAVPAASARLVHDALRQPELLTGLPERLSGPVRRVAALIDAASRTAAGGGSAYDVLWQLWSGTDWPRHLEAAALAGEAHGGTASRSAHRDLDAVLALFEAAARSQERLAGRGVRGFLDELQAQQIPGDTLAERGIRPQAVRLLTAHRSKGLEWEVVIVPGVQAETWPDLRRRGSLLDVDRLTADGEGPPPSVRQILAEERRLFYVAATRARRRLVVSAVDAVEDDGLRPSPFLDDLVDDADAVPAGGPTTSAPEGKRGGRPLSVNALVAELRGCLLDSAASPALKAHAAHHLASFAESGVRAADPAHWWGMRPLTHAGPVRQPDDPVRLSGSSLERLVACPLRWFLEHEAGAEAARSVAMGFGSVLHALADELGRGSVAADLESLDARLDTVWDALGFEAPWQSHAERLAARQALVRLLTWLDAPRGRALLATEASFDQEVTLTTADGPVTVLLRGFVDRLEVDQAGAVWVVDFKTGRGKPTNTSVIEHVQLGLYQFAVRHGALAQAGVRGEPGGAELVQLRHDASRGGAGPYVQQQPALGADGAGATFVDALLDEAADLVAHERFEPRPGDDCPRCPVRLACPAHPLGRQVVT